MTITTTTDTHAISISEEKSVILEEDMEWLKELAWNINKCTDRAIIRDAEHEFHEEMTNRYGGKVSGELLSMLWKMTS